MKCVICVRGNHFFFHFKCAKRIRHRIIENMRKIYSYSFDVLGVVFGVSARFEASGAPYDANGGPNVGLLPLLLAGYGPELSSFCKFRHNSPSATYCIQNTRLNHAYLCFVTNEIYFRLRWWCWRRRWYDKLWWIFRFFHEHIHECFLLVQRLHGNCWNGGHWSGRCFDEYDFVMLLWWCDRIRCPENVHDNHIGWDSRW